MFPWRGAMAVLSLGLIVATLPPVMAAEQSSPQAACAANGGTYLSGIVTTAPRYVRGKRLRNVPLSHTHVSIRGDADNKLYDVAIDNVFAAGYERDRKHVPAPLDTIVVGDRLGLCGKLYEEGDGIHWVHPNCGKRPSSSKPNGSIQKLDQNGNPLGQNLEASGEYCWLWD